MQKPHFTRLEAFIAAIVVFVFVVLVLPPIWPKKRDLGKPVALARMRDLGSAFATYASI
jgi:hypothetical protein